MGDGRLAAPRLPGQAEDFAGRVEESGLKEGAALFKGSRSQRMEEFLESFRARLREGKR